MAARRVTTAGGYDAPRQPAVEPVPALTARLCTPKQVADLVGHEMAGHEQEHLRVLLLDTKNGLRRSFDLYVGTVNGTTVRVAEIFREAVRDNAPRLIVAHNHPSGDTVPSPEDVRLTRALVEAGQLLDIELLDHLIIGGTPECPAYRSLREHGLGFEAPAARRAAAEHPRGARSGHGDALGPAAER